MKFMITLWLATLWLLFMLAIVAGIMGAVDRHAARPAIPSSVKGNSAR